MDPKLLVTDPTFYYRTMKKKVTVTDFLAQTSRQTN